MKKCDISGVKRFVSIVLAVLLLAGCATPRIDWHSRMGNYTYDQAIIEFGPPDKVAKLGNGMTVAEWLERRGQIVSAPEPYFLPPGCYFGPATPYWSQTYVPALFLRLTFGADGKLLGEKEVAK